MADQVSGADSLASLGLANFDNVPTRFFRPEVGIKTDHPENIRPRLIEPLSNKRDNPLINKAKVVLDGMKGRQKAAFLANKGLDNF